MDNLQQLMNTLRIPALNPFKAYAAICPNCGEQMLPEPDQKLLNGKTQSLVYIHVNVEKGCAYRVEHNGERLNGQCLALKIDELKKYAEDHDIELPPDLRDKKKEPPKKEAPVAAAKE